MGRAPRRHPPGAFTPSRLNRATALRTESVRASTLAGQQTQIEEDLFSHNPAAPASPFSMPQYTRAATVAANHLRQAAEERTAAALSTNQYSDDYVLLTVLFASTLLFAGLAPKFSATVVQSAMSGLALILLIAGAAFLIAFPRRY